MKNRQRLDTPMLGKRKPIVPRIDRERFGRASETFARALGTGGFLIGLTIFCAVWLNYSSVWIVKPVFLLFVSESIYSFNY